MNPSEPQRLAPWRPKGSKDEILNHWIAFADGFSVSPGEFYTAVEKELDARKVPGLEVNRVEYLEGGLLSEARVYLRLIRERLAFDTCAAPFGTGCFFSCRTIYSPPVLRFWHVLLAFAVLYLIYDGLARFLGLKLASIALVGLVIAIALVFRNAVASGLSDLDALLIKTPALGPIYERYFRKDTYFRQDARLIYLEAVSSLFKSVAEEMTATKGVKLVKQFERAPVLGELYKPVEHPSKPEQTNAR